MLRSNPTVSYVLIGAVLLQRALVPLRPGRVGPRWVADRMIDMLSFAWASYDL